MILKDGVRIYERMPELVNHWVKNGIAEIKKIENPWSHARKFNPVVEIAILNESHRRDVELVRDLMINFYNL